MKYIEPMKNAPTILISLTLVKVPSNISTP